MAEKDYLEDDPILKEEEKLSQEEKKGLLQMSEINLILEGYDDIFSDFDPRPYSQRSLSIDFLEEARRASRDKSFDGIELELLVPAAKRDENLEGVIRKRLHEHFKRHHGLITKDIKEIKKEGFIKVGIGCVLMTVALFIDHSSLSGVLKSIIFLFCEPGGWFFFWEGLNQVITEWKKFEFDLDFYEKMTKGKIKFNSY